MKRLAPMLVLLACGSNPPPPSPTPAPTPASSVTTTESLDASAPMVSTTADAEAPAPVALTYPTAPDDTDALILRREACNGTCPIYSVGVTSNGNVHFYGENFTKTVGYAVGKVAVDQVAALYKFMDTHPVSAASKKLARRPDHPTEYVVVHRRGAVKKLDPPGAIADEIDRVLATDQWVTNEHPMHSEEPPLPQPAIEAVLGKQLRGLDKCATAKTEIKLAIHITPEGKAKSSSTSGKKESDSTCIDKVLGSFLFPFADVNVAPLTLTIGK